MLHYEAVWDVTRTCEFLTNIGSQGLPPFYKHLLISEPPFGINYRVCDDGRCTAMSPAQLFGQGDLYIL